MANNNSGPVLDDDPTIKGLTAKIALNPDDVGALYRRGQVYASKGAYALAIKDFDDTIRLNPKDVEALNNRCWARTVVGDLQSALKINPRLTSSLYGRGVAKQRNGAASEGALDIVNAKAMDPNIVQEFDGYGVR